jgi:hypothetical protein
MDQEPDADDMAAIMGFSSFTEMPKPKRQKREEKQSEKSNGLPTNKSSLSSCENANLTPLGQRGSNKSSIPAKQTIPVPTKSQNEFVDPSSENQNGTANSKRRLPVAVSFSGTTHKENTNILTQNHKFTPANREGAVLAKNLDELTDEDLRLLRRGIRAVDGRTVYFSKRFIDDPWAALKK